ncbi:hypothetical protein ZHAS_00008664 [Anopheles sinensis]|uniref:Uncharacterized protein n=1 Tax=Anopheles sinensis TaxID=74873 RepID=A0A084VSU9_ANOSI|nr:hypothetical protein ZHAS_00008664 [Anopheles sinensis]
MAAKKPRTNVQGIQKFADTLSDSGRQWTNGNLQSYDGRSCSRSRCAGTSTANDTQHTASGMIMIYESPRVHGGIRAERTSSGQQLPRSGVALKINGGK